MPKYGCKVDANHAEIGAVFRALCPAVEDTSRVGGGFPDFVILTARAGVFLVEVKNGALSKSRRKLRPAQEAFRLRWGSRYVVVETRGQAEELALRGTMPQER